MLFKFKFKNINFSFKKIKKFFYNLINFSKYIFEILVYLNFISNKSSFILKKIFFYIINYIKNINSFFLNCFNLKMSNLLIFKGNTYKRLNYRAKGRTDFFLKKFCNIYFFVNG